MQTKLILIEGMPGSGKTTTTARLGNHLQQQGALCEWFFENDDPHPIDCLDFALKDLAIKMPILWRKFIKQALGKDGVTIIESRLWQNTALFMFMAEYPVAEINHYHQLVWRELSPLSPVLVYLHPENVENTLERVLTARGGQWMDHALRTTNSYQWFQRREINDFAGWVEFFQEWLKVSENLFLEWPHRKILLNNPHENWETSYRTIYRFLRIENPEEDQSNPRSPIHG